MSGFYLMHRGWMEHPVFKTEPYTEREAWVWLIENAAYRPSRQRIGGAVVDLDRGQVAASLRFMADRWDWKEPRVRRFLDRLKNDAMIDARADAGITVVTIRNYAIYQAPTAEADARTDAPADAGPTQQRRSTDAKEKEVNQGKEDSDDGDARARAASALVSHFLAERERLWPGNPNLPSNHATLATQAAAFLATGATAQLIARTISETAEKLHGRGDPNPPTNLRFCERTLQTRHAQRAQSSGEPPHGRARTERNRRPSRNGFCAIVAESAGLGPDRGPDDGGDGDRGRGLRGEPETVDLDPADWHHHRGP